MKAKDTLLLNNTTTQNPILARRAWIWHVSSHMSNHMTIKWHSSRSGTFLARGATGLISKELEMIIME